MSSSSTTHSTQDHKPDAPDLIRHDPAGLGELEQAILRMVWQQSEATADQVRAQLHAGGRPLKESTVRTVLRRLEEKGYLTHTVAQRTFLYRAAADGGSVAGRAAQRIIDRFCNGSVEALLIGMVDADVLSGGELQRLADKIAAARASGLDPGKAADPGKPPDAAKPARKPARRK